VPPWLGVTANHGTLVERKRIPIRARMASNRAPSRDPDLVEKANELAAEVTSQVRGKRFEEQCAALADLVTPIIAICRPALVKCRRHPAAAHRLGEVRPAGGELSGAAVLSHSKTRL
jgi:hypothetical protein